jgi:hypothetical protein
MVCALSVYHKTRSPLFIIQPYLTPDKDMEALRWCTISLHTRHSALCHCTMALHYLNALSALYDYVLCILLALSHSALCTVCIAGPTHQACPTVFRVLSLKQVRSGSRCEKRSVYPHSASVLKQVAKRGYSSPVRRVEFTTSCPSR